MNKKTFYAFVISFLLMIVVIILNRKSFESMKEYTNSVNHTRNVISLFEQLSNHFKSAQIYSPRYDSLPENEFYVLYKKEALQVTSELNTLITLVKDNAEQVRLVDSLSAMISSQIYTLLQKNISEIIGSGEGWRLNYLFGVIFALLAVAIIVSIFISTIFLSRRRLWLESFLESVLNTSHNGIVNYKAIRKKGEIVDFRLEFVNRSTEHLLGINSKVFLGKKLKDLTFYTKGLNLFERYVEVVETGNSSVFETPYTRDGIEKWFLVSLVRLDDGLTASFQDITQLKKYEEELKNNINQLERSNDELEQYAYVASHDLQEPLRKIRSFGSYLQETQAEKLDEKGRQHLEKIIKSAERMSVLIKDILSFSSMRREEDFVETDLNKIIESSLSDFDLSITQRGAVIEKDNLPTIEAIPLQMSQLFYNLFNNSLKFAKQGQKPQIRITSSMVTEEKRKTLNLTENTVYYEIIFSDNGIGFSQEYADQIFGLFKRLNDKQYYPGSGIGLALCKKVVENHNGLMYAKGKENGGASFFIYLPQKHTKLSS
jgi:PAS domain S-box-containing protein